MGKSKKVVVDGANIAFVEQTQDGKPKVSNIITVRKVLQEKGFEPIIVIDASLIHQIDDPQQLEGLIDQKIVHQAPAGTEADYFVLKTAEREQAQVVTNDLFEDYQDQFDWIAKARVPLMIIKGEVIFHGPSLEAEQE